MHIVTRSFHIGTALLGMWLMPVMLWSQSGSTAKPMAAADVMLKQVESIEKSLTGIATEMPAEKYDFAPTDGAFRGVRSFAKQIKHAASVHHLVAATLLGEPVTSDMSDERGPDAVKTKAEVLEYLAESFSALKRAISTVNNENAFSPINGVFGSAPDTRIGLIVVAISHSSNHYGQIVEYLRMNGLVPPRNP
jgi:uncharacterized damage-inducible protein DinB